MKNLCIWLLIMIFNSSSVAQTNIQQLEKKLSHSESKSLASLYNQLSEANLTVSLTKSNLYADSAVIFAKLHTDNQQLAIAYNNKGKYHFKQKYLDSAILYFTKATELAQKYKFNLILYKTYSNLGTVYSAKTDFDAALKHYKNAETYIKQQNNPIEYAQLQTDIGDIYYKIGDYQSALTYYAKSRSIYSQHKKNSAEIDCIIKIGSGYYALNDYIQAILYFEQTYSLADTAKQTRQNATVLFNMGLVHQAQGQLAEAFQFYMRSLSIFEKLNFSEGLATVYDNLAQIASAKNEFELADQYFNRALSLYEKLGNDKMYAWTISNLGSLYKKQGDLNKALQSYKSALAKQYAASDQNSKIAVTLMNIGEVFSATAHYDSAMNYFNSALSSNEQAGNTDGIAKSHYFLGRTLMQTKMFKPAETHLLRSKELSDSVGNTDLSTGIYLALSDLAVATGNFDKALVYYRQYAQSREQLFDANFNNELARLKANFETEKKVNELKNEKAVQEIDLKNQRLYKTIFITGFIIVSVLSTLLIIMYLRKKAAYIELVRKNREIVTIESRIDDQPKEFPVENEELTIVKQRMLLAKVHKVFETDKLYVNPGLTLNLLADTLETNRTYLSEAIRDVLNTNFNSFVNEARVKEARKLLTDENSSYTVETIGQMVGFNSKSTFNAAFKKLTGVTPSFYRESLK